MTRRITILALFLTCWLGLGSLQFVVNPDLESMVLATTALALLIAFWSGDLAEHLGLPAITGYVLAGVALGPATGMLDGAILWDLNLVEQVALGLLALSAGTQVDLRGPIRLARPSIGAALTTAVVSLVAVSGCALLAAPLHGGGNLTMTTALLLGVLALGTSPAIVGWITDSAERPADVAALGLSTTLGRTVVLVVAISLSLSLIGVPSEEALRVLIASPVAAAGLAFALRFATPRLDRRAALPLIVLLATCSPALQAVGAEPVLTLALTGLGIRNWLPDSARKPLDDGLGDMHLPAALVLFTLLGATLSVPEPALIFFIGALFITRAASLWLGCAIAGHWADAPRAFRANGWLVLIPQGELTLGLLATLAALAPEAGDVLRAPVEGMVALALLLGPISCRIALRRAGEQGEHPSDTTKSVSQPPVVDLAEEPEHPWRDPMAALVGPDDEAPRLAWAGTVQGLVHLRSHLREQVVGARLEHIAKAHKAASTHARQIVQNTAEAVGRAADHEERRRHVHEGRMQLVHAIRVELEPMVVDLPAGDESAPGLIEALASGMEGVVRSARTLLEAPETARHVTVDADDARWVRAGKLVKAGTRRVQDFLGRARPTREIPYRRLVRRTLAGEMVAALGPVEAMVSRAEYKALRRLEAHVNRADSVLVEAVNRVEEDPEALRQWLQDRVGDLREASKDAQADIAFLAEEPLHRVSEAMAKGLNRLAYTTDVAGTFALPESAIRYATAAPKVREAITLAQEERLAWQGRKRAQVHRTLLDLQLAELQVGMRDLVLRQALGPAVRMHSRVQALMRKALDMVQQARDAAASDVTPSNPAAEGGASEALLAELQRRVGRPLEGLINGLRSGAVIDRLIGALETATAELPESVHLLPEPSILALERGHSTTDSPTPVRVRDTARAFFDRRVAVSLAEHSRALETSAEEARAGIRDAQRLLSVHIARAAAADQTGPNGDHTNGDSEDDDALHRLTLETLDTVAERMAHEVDQTSETSAALLIEIAQTEADAVEELWTHLHAGAMSPHLDRPMWGLWRWTREMTTRAMNDGRVLALRQAVESLVQRVQASQQVAKARADTSLGGPARVREALRRVDPAQRNLPYVYGKLFALTPTENDAFVLGRDSELELLRENLDVQHHGASLVLGERGSGRSSLIRVALAETSRERSVIWLDTDTCLTSEDAVSKWAARALGMTEASPSLDAVASEIRQRAPVMLLDGLEALFVRSHGGLRAIDALMTLIVATSHHGQWLTTCERHVWRLLTAVSPIADAFDVTVDLRPLSSDAIREAIERRHRLSGLETSYARPRGLEVRAWLAHLWGTSPAERTFKQLTESSRGNPRVAMQLWQLSLTQEGQGQRAVEVISTSSVAMPEIQTLPEHLTPMLSLLFRQGVVDLNALEFGLGCTAAEGRAGIHALEMAGLVAGRTRADGSHGWALVPHACEAVNLFLEGRGLGARSRRLG